ncbi:MULTISPECIES: HEAT repeat domain-containing protein [unclassified Lysobacter]|uniref:HEAT repeat domain-containing protein n=1 Tax=unclassified Lysobacter TaxID=2635362 RepID=UPI001BE84AFF|nr:MULTISPECIES: HEAT repeat domain-containing protein [unclassified Lysobacter]MBT2748843.1 HEAT repeat domain-containing protein [Lysobacter sp. ISL-42]MBT2751110.1 HEAT repeat domain-containing protein [Lysobacter sp. ISL-50]MBT2779656.1 HEAT repeat domain-containing protein [Lysobacter sp. ISL-54]MBT2783426.1 HEAT repeat domain-containing protein [Lysobacter sp. ISL-52]
MDAQTRSLTDPRFAQFKQTVDDGIAERGLAAIVDMQPQVETLLRSGAIAARLGAELRDVLADGERALWWEHWNRGSLWSRHGLLLLAGPGWSLHLSRYFSSSSGIFTLSQYACIGVAAGAMTLSTYATGESFRNAYFEREQSVRLNRRIELDAGQAAAMSAGDAAFKVDVQRPTIVALLLSESAADLQWRFDPDTLRADSCISARLSDSELICIGRTMAAIGAQQAPEVLLELSRHPRHFVRWSAIQHLAKVDRRIALDRLHEALDDEHDDIRAAATRSLAALQPAL